MYPGVFPAAQGVEWIWTSVPASLSDSGGVEIESVASLILNDVTLTENSAVEFGGAISNNGTATLTNVWLGGGTVKILGGAIFNNLGAVLTVTKSTLSGNSAVHAGGGLANLGGVVTLTDVTLSGNSSGSDGGGAIYNFGTLMVTNATLSGNFTQSNGGIYNGRALTVTNATLSANTAGDMGGGIENTGTATLANVTLSGNSAQFGGGIFQSGGPSQTVALSSSILVTGVLGANCAIGNGAGPIVLNGYNLSSDLSCTPFFGQTGDLNATHPNLGPLADNSGPTLTLLPSVPSPAIDAIPAGVNGCGTHRRPAGRTAADQR